MRSFTNEQTIAEVVGALYDFAQEVHLYYSREGVPNWKNHSLITIKEQTLLNEATTSAKRTVLSNHQKLLLESKIQSGPTQILDPLIALFKDVPPLSEDTTGPCLEISTNIDDRVIVILLFNGVRIGGGTDRAELIEAIQTFIRVHENIDMAAQLEFFRLDTEHMPMTQVYQIYADTPENAVLRFAACSRRLRDAIRQGEDVRCLPTKGPDQQALLAAINSRTRDWPAPQKTWLTC